MKNRPDPNFATLVQRQIALVGGLRKESAAKREGRVPQYQNFVNFLSAYAVNTMMSLLFKAAYSILIAIYFLVLTTFGYTFLLADVEGKGLNGRMSRLLFISMPRLISRKVSDCLGPAALNSFLASCDYVLNKRNLIMPSL